MKTNQSSSKSSLWIVVWLAFVLVACNLGGSGGGQQPPTLAPRITSTPAPTLGFTGDGGQAVDIAPSNLETPVTSIDVEFFNLMQQVDVSRLRLHVETLEGFTTRHVNSAQNRSDYGIGAARDYIFRQFEEIAQQSNGRFTQPQYQSFDMTWNGTATQQNNVIGVLNGTGINAGFIVVGAHYDSINTDFSDATGFAPGANDNGTGVAALIELARVLSQRQFRSSIIFVAFSAEEVSRGGSKAFVSWAQQNRVDILAMLNLDGIGNNNNRAGQVDNSLRIFSCEEENFCVDRGISRHMARSVEFLGFAHSAPLPMIVESQSDRDGRYGDHYSFAEAGYPAIRFISTLEEWGNGSTQDTAQYVEWDYFRLSTQSIMLITVALADGPPAPRNISVRDTGTGTPTLVWEDVPGSNGYVIVFRRANETRYNGQLEWDASKGTSMSNAVLNNGDWAYVAIGTRGANGLIGLLSAEYPLPR